MSFYAIKVYGRISWVYVKIVKLKRFYAVLRTYNSNNIKLKDKFNKLTIIGPILPTSPRKYQFPSILTILDPDPEPRSRKDQTS